MTTDQPTSSPAPAPRSARGPKWLRALLGNVPTLLVIASIAAVGLWGHHTGWKAPKISELAEASTSSEKEDWCTEHGVPESTCIKCHPELVGGNAADWCKEHGVAESKCTICHPEILTKGVAADWCKEHGVPESSCPQCHPEIAVKGKAPPSETGAVVSLAPGATQPATASSSAATTVPQPTAGQTTATRPGKDPKTCQSHQFRVQFASADAVTKAGVKLGSVVERPMTATLTANAEISYDRTRMAQVASPLSGRATRIEKAVGQQVKKGDVLALIDSAEVGKAKGEFLQAMAALDLRTKTLRRMKGSLEKGFRNELEYQEAEAAHKEANIRVFNAQQALSNLGLSLRVDDKAQLPEPQSVQFLGLPKELVETFDPGTTTANLLPLLAPLDGVVIERNVVAGEVVEPNKPLLVIADTTRMWMTADVLPSDAGRVAVGQEVTFQSDAAPDQVTRGHVSWVSTSMDEQTRTVKLRADFENGGGLRANTFGKARITIRESPNAIAVPSEAVQWEGCCHIVFVRLTDTIYQTRKVQLGAKTSTFTEVIAGVVPGEVVATAGSNVLKSEILKSNLGAGCTDD